MESYLIWGICLLAAAVVLLFLEVFVPSMGLLSLTALVVAVAGVVCLFQISVAWGFIGLASFVVLGVGALSFALRIFPDTPIGRRLVYGDDADRMKDPEDQPPPGPPVGEFDAFLGREGTAVSDLRPVGTIRIDDRKFSAVSETSFITAGAPVRVVSVEGNQVKVRPIT